MQKKQPAQKKPTPKEQQKVKSKTKFSPKDPPAIVQALLEYVGAAINAKRMEMGWSMQDLQKASGVTYVTISQIERGLAKNTLLSNLVAICQALKMDLRLEVS